MPEKRMLIVPAELVKKIDENRGDLSQWEFIEFLIDSQLKQDSTEQGFVTKEALHEFEQNIKDLLRSFLEFFVSYGLELGARPADQFEELTQKLQGLGSPYDMPEQRRMPRTGKK